MSDEGFEPFADDSTVVVIDGLSIENGQASIILHGDLEISRNQYSIDLIDFLMRTLEVIRAAIPTGDSEGGTVATIAPDEVANPFG